MILAFLAIGSSADKVRVTARNPSGRRNRFTQRPRGGRDGHLTPTGGIDFSGCKTDPDTGFCCVEVEESVTTLKKDPILECTHKNVEKCHYTYVTQFEPTAEEVCQENFEKICQITFKQEATEEEVQKCYKPLVKTCNGQGEEICQTVFESSCTTRYIEKQPGKFVGDTKCEKQPVDICGAGCTTSEGPEECHDKTVMSLIDIPEEVCDLNPQKTCRFQTKLVPSLKPAHECTVIPQEVCNLKFSNPEVVDQPLKTKWCQDPSDPTPGETYEESEAAQPVYAGAAAPRGGRTEDLAPPPPAPVQTVQQFSNQQGDQSFSQQFNQQPQFTQQASDPVPVFNQGNNNNQLPRQGRRQQGRRGSRRRQNGNQRFSRMISHSEDEDEEEEKAITFPKTEKTEQKATIIAKSDGEKSMKSVLASLL